jgi:hypothetical protein
MNNTKEARAVAKELEILQDIFIFLLLDASLPQQTVRKIVKVDLSRVTRIGKLLKTRQKD